MFFWLTDVYSFKVCACRSSRLFLFFLILLLFLDLPVLIHTSLPLISIFRFGSRLLYNLQTLSFGSAVWGELPCCVWMLVSSPKPMSLKLMWHKLRLWVSPYLFSFKKISKILWILAISMSIICVLFVFLTLIWCYFQGFKKSAKNRYKPYIGLYNLGGLWSFSDRIFRYSAISFRYLFGTFPITFQYRSNIAPTPLQYRFKIVSCRCKINTNISVGFQCRG